MCASTAPATTVDRPKRTQGQNWIWPIKRLAIYARDGFCCAYCGKGVEAGVTLTLDHLVPYSKGGAIIDPANLITACRNCNSARGNRDKLDFLRVAAAFHQRRACDMSAYINRQIKKPLDMKAAAALIAQRGSCRKVLDQVQEGGLQ